MTKIILARHGQTEWNRVERFRGRADVPLNQTGRSQAEATGIKVAKAWQPAAIFSSPLSRAMDTGKAIARQVEKIQGRTFEVQAHAGLIDIDYGEWQGLTPEEVRQRWPQAIDDWYNSPHLAVIPGGESLADLQLRSMEAVSQLAAQKVGQTIVLVGHTVINRVILLAILGLDNECFWKLKQDNCAINVFEAINNDYVLECLNDTCHLNNNGSAV